MHIILKIIYIFQEPLAWGSWTLQVVCAHNSESVHLDQENISSFSLIFS